MAVLESPIVCVFGGKDEGTEENAVESPLFCLDRKMGFRAVDVDEGHQEGRNLNVCCAEDIRDEVREVGAPSRTLVRPATGGGRSTQRLVNHFRSLLDQMVLSRLPGLVFGIQCGSGKRLTDENTVDVQAQELKNLLGVVRGLDKGSFVNRGHFKRLELLGRSGGVFED